MTDDPADAIDGIHLPWIEPPPAKLPETSGISLCAADWPMIERALNAAGWVVVSVEPSAPDSGAPKPPLAPATAEAEADGFMQVWKVKA